ncbi:tRNA (adenosine(37)-N6)-threonylcarbamoyltransferase complex ATPase subunit type 1 TsaE [Herbiconiux sp. L3-i23]|uniref:tRNA (adenosine(37)-N6)-threonylcarbamoyltransferase complex ATPase subunit type 1 TsaE n=1 Tax=Herbiconiux sp. L3-i23 TaxID=2905871 RepID=UPI002063984D|nr:tRNA (adenosine(37)-N6)-threonylcarbamoyltransferase complex ATPase subunit type 1 TsaE [Herbiconiux sp. L3-i23]BDI23835.1 tRNA threonylcarbamoyladenosine biosynthesis protein TsaE [Herbiconiux sp. L3-i23]
MRSVIEVSTPDDMHEIGVRLGRMLRAGDLVLLTGPLGAGKTTLTRGIGEGMGVRGPVTSPTFVLARTHPSLVGGPALVHVDAYRLGSAVELDDLDLDYAGSVVVAEWAADYAPDDAGSVLAITIERPLGAGSAATGDERGADGGADDDAADEPVETRLLRIDASEPRWSAEEIGALH